MDKKNPRFKISTILFYLIAITYACLTIGPFVWSIIISLKPASELGNINVNFSKLNFDSYTYIWNKFPFLRWTINSVIVTLIITTGNLLLNSMAGYAMARIEFPGRNALFLFCLGMMMIPGQVILVPQFMVISKLGWVNTYQGLTVPFLTGVFGIFLMRQFFLSIPKSLEEAALIDGMGRFGIFFKIILPLAKPALSTQFILTIVGTWGSFLMPSILTSTEAMFTLPVGLNSFKSQYFSFDNQVMAGAMILTLPAVIIFIIFQKNFIKGIATTGLKD